MSTYFITGSDTAVGKTMVTAGIANLMINGGMDVGVMKPFAAGTTSKTDPTSDMKILMDAARSTDLLDSVCPQYYEIPASPYTACKKLGTKPDVSLVMREFENLKQRYEILLIEGMGGIMTPILEKYYVADLIRDMKSKVIITVGNKIGSLNHSIMTCRMCAEYELDVLGIIISQNDKMGYEPYELKSDLEEITRKKVIGIVPWLDDTKFTNVAKELKNMLSQL